MAICLNQNRNQLCFIFGFVLLLFPIDLPQGHIMENFYKVKVCPLSKIEWKRASQRLNCTDDMDNPVNRYHCLPVHNLTALVEFCYNQIRPRVVKGLCMVYVQGIKTINNYNCSNFEEGCPDTNYFSDESYKFSGCIQIDPTRRCYLAEPSCRPDTHNYNDNRVPVAWFISSAAVIIVILIAIAATCTWRRRGCHKRTEITNEEELKNLTNDKKTEITNEEELESLANDKKTGWRQLYSNGFEKDIVLSEIDGEQITEVTHISRVTSEIMWIENKDRFMKIDHSGRILFKHNINVYWGCSSFTVDENGDVLYINGDTEVIKMSSTGENPTQLIKNEGPLKIINICSTRLGGEVLLRVIDQKLNKYWTYIARYNKNGEYLFQFDDKKYDKLQTSPWFLSVNINGNICVSDQLDSEVRAFDEEGKKLYTYKGRPLRDFSPTGICNDFLGNVLVCNESYLSVHMLDMKGDFIRRIIYDIEDVKDPWGLCADDNGKLFIGQKNCGMIKVFKYL